MPYRTGLGYDIHRTKRGRPFILGGVRIPGSKGLAGHSDGDVLVHALIDGLLGAMGEGDIGTWFPDTDPAFKDIASTELLKKVMEKVRQDGFSVVHIDSVIVAEKPKLNPYIQRMKTVLCPLLSLRPENLGIKAKTNEGLGPSGRGKAVTCWAQVLLAGPSTRC